MARKTPHTARKCKKVCVVGSCPFYRRHEQHKHKLNESTINTCRIVDYTGSNSTASLETDFSQKHNDAATSIRMSHVQCT